MLGEGKVSRMEARFAEPLGTGVGTGEMTRSGEAGGSMGSISPAELITATSSSKADSSAAATREERVVIRDPQSLLRHQRNGT